MIFDRNENKEVIALLGAGSMGTAIARRFAAGRIVLLGDISEKNLERVSNELKYSGYTVETCVSWTRRTTSTSTTGIDAENRAKPAVPEKPGVSGPERASQF